MSCHPDTWDTALLVRDGPTAHSSQKVKAILVSASASASASARASAVVIVIMDKHFGDQSNNSCASAAAR
jgi:hypothetical protein